MYSGTAPGWMWLLGALLVAGLAVLVVVAVRLTGGRPAGPATGDPRGTARALLDERYARGEISTEEYRERRRALEDGP